MPCLLCEEFKRKHPSVKNDGGKFHELDGFCMEEIRCAFACKNNGRFRPEANWNCMTMNALRLIANGGKAEADDDGFRVNNATYKYRFGDCSIGVIPFMVRRSFLKDYRDYCDYEGFLVLSWYKDRGRVSRAFILIDGHTLPFTYGNAQRILEANAKVVSRMKKEYW